MDQEEAPPPPYAAVDPLHDGTTSQQTSAHLQDNGLGSSAAGSSRIAELPPSNIPAIVPTHFTSAAAYFEERPPTVMDDTRSILNHHMTIYPRSQAKDFPRRPRCWAPRTAEIPQQDWDTFLRYLFPSELGLASASQHLPRQLRAEIQRDRKDRPQESDEQRRARIMTVVDEWNQCFFEPRATRIVFVYIGEPDAAPSTALCPRCYPASTRTTQGSTTASVASDPQSPWSPNTPSPVPGQHAQTWPAQPSPYAAPPGHMPYAPQYGAPPGHYHPPPPPHQGIPPWQWNGYPYAQPQTTNPGSGKGAFGWISDITAQAQKYGDRFAEKAQKYGDQISGQAMHYGRQIEEHAMARSRWFEEQARLGRNPNPYAPAGYYHHPAWGPPPPNGNMYHTPTPPTPAAPVEIDSTTPAPPTPQPQAPAPAQTQTQTTSPQKPESPDKEGEKNIDPTERTRRASVSSTASESSLSSFNSISTTSDLDASDLAKVRTQLQSLNECHERTLYDAAADLRHQLDVLQVSRREARSSGRQNWRHGRRNPAGDQQARDETDWGRWDSPEAQERQANEKKAMKDELRATKKAFREVVRRARQEQHEAKRARKARRRQLKNKSVDNGPVLAQHMDNLTLNQPQPIQPVRVQTQPALFPTFPPPPGRADTGSAISSVGSLHTPTSSQASMHELPAEAPDRKGKSGMQKKLRDKLKRGKKHDKESKLVSKDDAKSDGARKDKR